MKITFYLVECEAGTYRNMDVNKCEKCAKGYFTSTTGSSNCSSCSTSSSSMTTEDVGSTSKHQCFQPLPCKLFTQADNFKFFIGY